ncbi:MAG: CaiB/BaiF CoA-transferase family protein [Pseudomonadota bacterium]
MDYPLTGLKVLDFARVLAGPFAGRMLCDLGADVVKVEPPEGDVTRYWGHVMGGVAGYYNQWNAGKRNICVDLRAPGAVDLIKELVVEADILVENYRSDVMPRLGLGYDVLSQVNPGLIMLSISGFGQNGPESHRPTYAPVVHAESGLVNRHAERSGAPWFDLPTSVADTNAGLHGLIGILSAVYMRSRTGKGQHIDMAMIDATVATDDQLLYELEDSKETGPLPSEIWDTGIGPILLSTDFRFFWRCITQDYGVQDPTNPEMSRDGRIAARRKATAEFMLTLKTREQVTEMMNTLNIPWGDVRRGEKVFDQSTLRARNSIIDIDNRDGGTRPVTQSPYRFSDATSGIRGPAPHQGEHNEEVLSEWLGTNADTVSRLREQGILLTDERRETQG